MIASQIQYIQNDNEKIKSNERFIRWQGILREHVTFLNNLLLAIAIAIIGYLISTLKEPTFNVNGYKKALFSFGLILTLLSTLFALAAAFSRLFDFRTTLKKIRTEIENKNSTELETMKTWIELYGKTTWSLLYFQIGTFMMGTLVLVVAFCFIYFDKLF